MREWHEFLSRDTLTRVQMTRVIRIHIIMLLILTSIHTVCQESGGFCEWN